MGLSHTWLLSFIGFINFVMFLIKYPRVKRGDIYSMFKIPVIVLSTNKFFGRWIE